VRARRWLVAMLTHVATTALMLFGLLFVTFAIGRLLPMDPVLVIVGEHATPEAYQRVFHQMRLDRSVPAQFGLYLSDMARGDFGVSISTGSPIGSDLARFFPATLELATIGMIIGIVAGLPLGVVCARYAGRAADHAGRVFALLGHSMPVFWLGLLALLVFYARLGWVEGPGRLGVTYQYTVSEVTGLVLVDTLLSGDWAAFRDAVAHIVLPGGLLGLIAVGTVARMTRGFLLFQMRQDYVTVLRLKGLSESAILWRHALPNAFGPFFAVLAWTYAYLLEGAVLTETVFSWPGLGLYIAQSLFSGDIPAVLAGTLVVGVTFMALNVMGEAAQTAFDPRQRGA